MEGILKVWNYLSGKKTVVGAVLKALSDIAVALGQPEYAGIIDQIGNALIAIGLMHKGVKVVK